MKPIIGVTGHRDICHNKETLRKALKEVLLKENAGSVITGMAVGFDTLVAEVCIESGIPFIAAVPCLGQERVWPKAVQEHYKTLLESADRIHITSSGGYAAWKMFVRNQWIVDNSSLMIAYHDGSDKGGTASCVAYALKQKRKVINLYNVLSLSP